MSEALPVLQGIQRPLDNTALQAYMACPREYYFSMVEHRRGEGLSAALAFGKAWHTALELHYKGLPAEHVEALVRASWEQPSGEGDYRTVERVLLDFRRYREKWGHEPSREAGGPTLLFDGEPMVELSVNAAGEGLIHPYAGKIDRIIRIGGLIYVEDHKTTSRLDKNYYSGFELSQQMMGYVYLAQQLIPGERIAGVRINVLHVLKEKSNFERQLFTYTREQIAEWIENTNEWMRRVDADSLSWQNLPEGKFPLAHLGDNGCSRKYGLCQYHRVCSVAPTFRRRVLEEFPVHPWNPLEIED
jgi:hypothetical protein